MPANDNGAALSQLWESIVPGHHNRYTPRQSLNRHGTNAAYMRHWRRGEKPCDLCSKAHSAYELWRQKTTPEERKLWTIKVRERKVSDSD